MHFEDLWELCEKLHQQADSDKSSSLIDELALKLAIYKAIDQKSEIPIEEQQKAKCRTLGEILLTLTNISLTDNINVFEALSSAYKFRSVDIFSKKY